MIRRAPIAFGAALLLAGCQTFSTDGGMTPVAALTQSTIGKSAFAMRSDDDVHAAHKTVERLLKRPLSVDEAVQIALLNNRGLQAVYNELGAAEAGMVGASLPPNPTISLLRLAGTGEVEIERRIVANILALATLPTRAEIAKDQFRQAQLRATAETLRMAADARRAYVRAVAARESVAALEQAQMAAGSVAQFSKRLGESGAMNKLDQAREQVFYADISTQVASARLRAESERESLIRVLGLWGKDLGFRLRSRLPALPARAQTLPAIEIKAIRGRVDLQIARNEVKALAKSYGLTQATRFINLLDVAGASKTTRPSEGETVNQRGLEVEFQIPLFDFGEVRVREGKQRYQRAVNRLIEIAVNVRSQARDAYRGYRAAYDIAAHYQREVLPLRKIISDETLLRYNAMQVDVFALLAETRQRVAATAAAIDARRDFWLAETTLRMAVIGGDPIQPTSEAASTTIASSAEPAGH